MLTHSDYQRILFIYSYYQRVLFMYSDSQILFFDINYCLKLLKIVMGGNIILGTILKILIFEIIVLRTFGTILGEVTKWWSTINVKPWL